MLAILCISVSIVVFAVSGRPDTHSLVMSAPRCALAYDRPKRCALLMWEAETPTRERKARS